MSGVNNKMFGLLMNCEKDVCQKQFDQGLAEMKSVKLEAPGKNGCPRVNLRPESVDETPAG